MSIPDPCYRDRCSFRSLNLSPEENVSDTRKKDEEDARASGIIFHEKESEGKRLPAPETSTPVAVVGGDEDGGVQVGEYL